MTPFSHAEPVSPRVLYGLVCMNRSAKKPLGLFKRFTVKSGFDPEKLALRPESLALSIRLISPSALFSWEVVRRL